jgi:RimJ/RimL family protein N-acetyltransferase
MAENHPVLTTERLILRQFQEADLGSFADIVADPEVMRCASFTGKPLSRAEAWQWLCVMAGHWRLRGYGMWAVEEKSSGQLIGRIGLQYPDEFPDVEIAWMLARSFWGRGLAFEGASAAVQWGFETLGKEKLISLIFPENTRSIRLAGRLGESLEGEIELYGRRLLQYSIRREDWR